MDDMIGFKTLDDLKNKIDVKYRFRVREEGNER